jgi:hypothetical protein
VKRIGFLIWLAVVVWACDGSSDGGREPESSAAESFILPSDAAKPAVPAGPRSVTGILSFDDIEGGCAFVETADRKRFEVLYPEGWQLDRRSGVLRGPSGELVHAGDTLTVRGSIATGRSSICQVGPIFQATVVELPTR